MAAEGERAEGATKVAPSQVATEAPTDPPEPRKDEGQYSTEVAAEGEL